MKRLIVFLLCMVLAAAASWGAKSDQYANLRVFATDVTLQKMLKFPSGGNYIYVTTYDSVAVLGNSVYVTAHFVSGDTIQFPIHGKVVTDVTHVFTTWEKFDSVHVVRSDTTTAVRAFISRVPRTDGR